MIGVLALLLASPPVIEGKARVGAGGDSNVLHDRDARQQGAMLRLDGEVSSSPVERLLLSLSGSYEPHLPVSGLNEAEVQLLARYFIPFSPEFHIDAGNLAEFKRDLSVFADGLVFNLGSLREQAAEHLRLAAVYDFGLFEIEAGVRGDVRSVFGVHSELGFEPAAALRFVPTSRFAATAVYAYSFRSFMNSLARNPAGEIVIGSRDVEFAVHAFRGVVRTRLADSLSISARYDLELGADNFLGFLDGTRHHGVFRASWELGSSFAVALEAELFHRIYPLRRPSGPCDIDRTGNLCGENQKTNTIFAGVFEAEYWFTDLFGVFIRYSLERDSARILGDPTEADRLLFIRHTVTAGAAGRLKWDGDDRIGWYE